MTKRVPLESEHRIGPIRFGRECSHLDCTCGVGIGAPTPELLDREWMAHRREVNARRSTAERAPRRAA